MRRVHQTLNPETRHQPQVFGALLPRGAGAAVANESFGKTVPNGPFKVWATNAHTYTHTQREGERGVERDETKPTTNGRSVAQGSVVSGGARRMALLHRKSSNAGRRLVLKKNRSTPLSVHAHARTKTHTWYIRHRQTDTGHRHLAAGLVFPTRCSFFPGLSLSSLTMALTSLERRDVSFPEVVPSKNATSCSVSVDGWMDLRQGPSSKNKIHGAPSGETKVDGNKDRGGRGGAGAGGQERNFDDLFFQIPALCVALKPGFYPWQPAGLASLACETINTSTGAVFYFVPRQPNAGHVHDMIIWCHAAPLSRACWWGDIPRETIEMPRPGLFLFVPRQSNAGHA